MLYTIYDDMGYPHLVQSNNPIGNNVVDYLPLVPNQFGPTGNHTDNSSLNQSASGLLEVSNLHNTLLTNNQLVASGTGASFGDTSSAQNPTTSVKRPWLEMGEGGVPFDQQQLAALGGVGTTTVVVRLTVPDGYDGVINAYSWNCTFGGFINGNGDLVVQILNNGAAIRNYDNILTERGSIQEPRKISPLRIYSGRTYTLVVNHVANGLLAGNIVGGFTGYFYPSAS